MKKGVLLIALAMLVVVKAENMVWQNMLQSVSANMKQIGAALEKMKQQKKFFQQMADGKIAQAAQATFKGGNGNNFQERLDNNIKMAEEKLTTLA